ncbi:MAG: DUF1822 family protein [Acaryochloridaceae cyanobacterium RL_2_7]|nr:DUF1822 family protein [Acaryochloridaceae cyanobacterium RL_2_7]
MMNLDWDNDSRNEPWERIPLEAIALSQRHFSQARQWSQLGYGEPQQWQIYRNGLLLLGLVDWLTEHGVTNVNIGLNSLRQAAPANLLNAVTGIKIGPYQVVLCESDNASVLTLPRLLIAVSSSRSLYGCSSLGRSGLYPSAEWNLAPRLGSVPAREPFH